MTVQSRRKASRYFNWWMAISNIGFVWPLCIACVKGQEAFVGFIAFSCISSAIYHFYESQKHNLPGGSKRSVFSSKNWNEILINVDRAASGLLIVYTLLELYYIDRVGEFLLHAWWLVLLALATMTISETVYRHETHNYVFYHTLWHFLAAGTLSVALQFV